MYRICTNSVQTDISEVIVVRLS